PLGTFIAVVQDINSNILVGDSSTITLTLSHGTFANGQATVSAPAVNGIATFSNLDITAAGSYILRATDANPNLDPGFAPFTVTGQQVAVKVDDGSAQRSMVRSLTVSFAGAATFAGASSAAFQLTGPTGVIGLNVAVNSLNGMTVATLTFNDPSVVGGSLAD